MIWEAVLLSTQLVVLGILALGALQYIRLRHQLWNYTEGIRRRFVNMEMDAIIDDFLEADSGAVAKHDTTSRQYQRRAGPETTTRSVSDGGEDTGTTDTKYH